MNDPLVRDILEHEQNRQNKTVNLIASENYVSRDVLEALGSEFTNKYAEGYPGARYYQGNEFIDQIELLAQARALQVFGLSSDAWHVNVQALSGSPANVAVYSTILEPGAKIMALELASGGHLSHGYKVSITGKFWQQVPYTLDPKTHRLDYEAIRDMALRERPAMIIAGYSAYPRSIDWKKFREIADESGAMLMADISHIAGLIAGGVHDSPFPYADVVTTTTHKTLRGPRGALIFAKKDTPPPRSSAPPLCRGGKTLAEKIDKAVFPGLQGGPHMNQVAAIAVALGEALAPSFKEYTEQVIKNARALSDELKTLGWNIISGGTDNHIVLVDVFGTIGMGGQEAAARLEAGGIIVNKNGIPGDARSPLDPSGIRLGSPAETTRGKIEEDFRNIARRIDEILRAS